jgi:hypothetical protein
VTVTHHHSPRVPARRATPLGSFAVHAASMLRTPFMPSPLITPHRPTMRVHVHSAAPRTKCCGGLNRGRARVAKNALTREIPSVVAHGSLSNAVPPATSARNP